MVKIPPKWSHDNRTLTTEEMWQQLLWPNETNWFIYHYFISTNSDVISGYRKGVQFKDLYDLPPTEESSALLSIFNNHYSGTKHMGVGR